MKIDVTSISGKAAGSLDLNEAIFGLDPRADLIARMVRWQLAKRQSGDHKTLGRADIHRTGKKMYIRRAPAAPATARRACRSSAAAAAPWAR